MKKPFYKKKNLVFKICEIFSNQIKGWKKNQRLLIGY